MSGVKFKQLPGRWAIVHSMHTGTPHCVPLGDDRIHEINPECWCKPEICGQGMVWAHNAKDGREDFESGHRKYS